MKLLFAPSRVRGLKQLSRNKAASIRVRTFTGAWIETAKQSGAMLQTIVRTFTGAWIETAERLGVATKIFVRTFTGAWIETIRSKTPFKPSLVRTFTGAWIETETDVFVLNELKFAPSRVRGLKPDCSPKKVFESPFAPSRVRGLKRKRMPV